MGALVFVEGVPGSGKSTTAQFLTRELARHGRPARWIYEEQAPNPLVPAVPDDAYRDWEHFAALHVERWRAFATATAASDETIVVESFLLQRPVFTMLRRDADVGFIEVVVNRFADAVASLAPSLVYLAHNDPARAWRTVAAGRGADYAADVVRRSEEWPYIQSRGLAGLDGVLAYWQAHGALCDKITSWIPMRTLVVDATHGTWDERRRRICDFLELPWDAPPRPDEGLLARHRGTYRDGDREIVVDVVDGRLVLRGVLWATNVLLPVAPNVFDVEAWPFQVSFDDGTLTWHGPRLGWGGPTGTYRRV
jgi:hypothetical protein